MFNIQRFFKETNNIKYKISRCKTAYPSACWDETWRV